MARPGYSVLAGGGQTPNNVELRRNDEAYVNALNTASVPT